MKKAIFAAIASLWAIAPLCGQMVSFAVSLDHQSYVVGEQVEITFRVKNDGVTPIVISDFEAYRDNRMEIEIIGQDRTPLKPYREGVIIEELSLEKDEAQTFKVPLADWFAMGVGHYQVRIRLFNNGLRFDSPTEVFDVVPGMELASARHFVGRNPAVERTLSLVFWAREGQELAFLRATDRPSGGRWRTILLGDIMRVKKPSIERNPKVPGSFFIYRQMNRDTLSRIEVISDEEGVRIAEVKRAVESASSPMIDSLREAVEKRGKGKGKKK